MKLNHLLPAALLVAFAAVLPARAQDSAAAPASPAATGTVYVAQLPTATQLMKDADAEGVTITRIETTAEKVLVTYKYASGTVRTYAYLPLPANGELPGTNGTRVVEVTQAPTVIYTEPPRVYYSGRYDRYYDPVWDFWAPLTIGVGLGWGFGGHGHYYGGHHGRGH